MNYVEPKVIFQKKIRELEQGNANVFVILKKIHIQLIPK